MRVELDEVNGIVGVGRINKESVMLESTGGQLVKLNLNRIFEEKRPLFLAPGSIVVVEGVNTNGRSLDVHAVHDCTDMSSTALNKEKAEIEFIDSSKEFEDVKEPPKLEESEAKVEDELVHESMDDVSRVKMMSAAGPIPTSANLQYEPLNDILDIAVRESPDIVILMGPFVDIRHQMMKPSTLPIPFEDIFEIRMMRRIIKAAKSAQDTKFVLVPSLEDVHHTFVARCLHRSPPSTRFTRTF